MHVTSHHYRYVTETRLGTGFSQAVLQSVSSRELELELKILLGGDGLACAKRTGQGDLCSENALEIENSLTWRFTSTACKRNSDLAENTATTVDRQGDVHTPGPRCMHPHDGRPHINKQSTINKLVVT